jgi:hypothetical protein
VVENKSVADLNPRSQPVKTLEMTVIRCLGLIAAFEALEKGEDWTDVPSITYRKTLGDDHYQQRAVISECWNRFKSGTLYSQVLDLAANLPPAALERKEIHDGIRAIRKQLDSRGKGRADDAASRKRQR